MIELPIQEKNNIHDPYNIKQIISDYCGFNHIPSFFNENICWQHGWYPAYRQQDPLMISGQKYNSKLFYLVSKHSEELFLKKHGYLQSKALGLPIIYFKQSKKYTRLKNSLLVMPVHSVANTTHESWKFQEYVNTIISIKHLFSKITICIHPSCIEKGYWINEFKDSGFEIIEGIDGWKTNSFERLSAMMSTFEYVTTNGFTSALVYAGYFGAKPSIYGDFCEYEKEDYINDTFYQQNPEILEKIITCYRKESVFNAYPKLFTIPNKASSCEEWAKEEIGYDQKLSSNEIKKLFGLNKRNAFLFLFTKKGILYFFSKLIPVKVKNFIKNG